MSDAVSGTVLRDIQDLAAFSRRLSSLSTASRMKSDRFSFSASTASIRASVPSGKRAGVCSSLIRIRPTGRFVPDITNSVNAGILLISPIDDQSDIFYLDDVKLRRKGDDMTRTEEDRRIDLYHLGWEDHKRGEPCPSHWPERAEGWEARDRAVNVRVVEVIRLEGYYHAPVGSMD